MKLRGRGIHGLVINQTHDALVVDQRRRGGLVLQLTEVHNTLDGSREFWNAIFLSKAETKRLAGFIRHATKPKPRRKR